MEDPSRSTLTPASGCLAKHGGRICNRELASSGAGVLCDMHLAIIRGGGEILPRAGLSADQAQALRRVAREQSPGSWYSGLFNNPAVLLVIAPLLLLPMEIIRMEALNIPASVRFGAADTLILLANNLFLILMALVGLWFLHIGLLVTLGLRLMPSISLLLAYLVVMFCLGLLAIAGSLALLAAIPVWGLTRAVVWLIGLLRQTGPSSPGVSPLDGFRALVRLIVRNLQKTRMRFLDYAPRVKNWTRDRHRSLVWALTSRAAHGRRIFALRLGAIILLAVELLVLANFQGTRAGLRIAGERNCTLDIDGGLESWFHEYMPNYPVLASVGGIFDWPVSCGRLVLASGYPVESSGLKPATDRPVEATGAPRGIMTESVFYIGDFGEWAVVAPYASPTLRLQLRRSAITEFVAEPAVPENVTGEPDPTVPPVAGEFHSFVTHLAAGTLLAVDWLGRLLPAQPDASSPPASDSPMVASDRQTDVLLTISDQLGQLNQSLDTLFRAPDRPALAVVSDNLRAVAIALNGLNLRVPGDGSGEDEPPLSRAAAQLGFDTGACLREQVPLLFDFAERGSQPGPDAQLTRLVTDFGAELSARPGLPHLVLIRGGASDTGPSQQNIRLSERRAEAVKRALAIRYLGLAPGADNRLIGAELGKAGLVMIAYGLGERPDRSVHDSSVSGRAVEIFVCPLDLAADPAGRTAGLLADSG